MAPTAPPATKATARVPPRRPRSVFQAADFFRRPWRATPATLGERLERSRSSLTAAPHSCRKRRAWDSNPRNITAHQFSRLAPSAARTALQVDRRSSVTDADGSTLEVPCESDRDTVVQIGCRQLVRGIPYLLGCLAHCDAHSPAGDGPAQHVDVVAPVADCDHVIRRDAELLAHPFEAGRLVHAV